MMQNTLITEDSYPYVTGNGFRKIADMVWDEYRQDKPDKITKDGQVVFVKTDFVPQFFESVLSQIKHRIKIITHNSAFGIDMSYIQYLSNVKIIKWYAQNANLAHPKLKSIPLGIANKRWPHGNIDLLENITNQDIPRTNLAYLNFDISTNSSTRTDVHDMFYNQNYVYSAPKKPFKEYLKDLRSSKFCISPQGRGVDCHRIWESIFVGTIPIVKNCNNVSFYKDMPILIIEDWRDVNQSFLEEKYDQIISNPNKSKLYMDYWLREIALNKI